MTGSKIRDLRLGAGLTQFQLAVASGVSVRAIASAEAGRAVPSVRTLARLADALGVDIGDLLRAVPR